MRQARCWGVSGSWQAAEVDAARLVDYANATNALLNVDRGDRSGGSDGARQARDVLLNAAAVDASLAEELRAIAAALPKPAECRRHPEA